MKPPSDRRSVEASAPPPSEMKVVAEFVLAIPRSVEE